MNPNDLGGPRVITRAPPKKTEVGEAESRGDMSTGEGVRVKERQEGALLLALKTEEGTGSQGLQCL